MSTRILIIEESSSYAEAIKIELNNIEAEFNFRVVSNESGIRKALKSWSPEVIISDYDPEIFSGIDILRTLRRLSSVLPIIILTKGLSRSLELQLLESGANDVLNKEDLKRLPFSVKRILKEQNNRQRLNSTLFELAGNIDFQEALAEISLIFNSQENFDEKINDSLKIIGEIADVSRAYIFEDSEGGSKLRNTFEWCADGVQPQIEELQDLSYEEDLPSWKPILLNNGKIYAKDIHTLPKDIISILEPQEIKSIIVYPLFEKNEFFGFIGFDEIREKRDWSESEDKFLKTVSGIIGNAYGRHLLYKNLEISNKELNNLLIEKEALVSELHHRVKNNLALISSFLQLDQLGLGVNNAEDIITSNISRIKSISVVHEIIYEFGDFSSISIRETIERVLSESFSQAGIKDLSIEVRSVGNPVKFNINLAVSFSLLISEMIFEVFNLELKKPFQPSNKFQVKLHQKGNSIFVDLVEEDFVRVTESLLGKDGVSFSEIFNVITSQLNAEISINQNMKSVTIQFKNTHVKGSSGSLMV
jgi:two-component sensor histidine kinase